MRKLKDAAAIYRVPLGELAAKHGGAVAGMGARVKTAPEALIAYVSNGRWVADCPCLAGIAVTPGDTRAWCFGLDCGRVFASVVFPANWQDIEDVLEKRHVTRRNWTPGVSVDDLNLEDAKPGKE